MRVKDKKFESNKESTNNSENGDVLIQFNPSYSKISVTG